MPTIPNASAIPNVTLASRRYTTPSLRLESLSVAGRLPERPVLVNHGFLSRDPARSGAIRTSRPPEGLGSVPMKAAVLEQIPGDLVVDDIQIGSPGPHE